jgi:hypothetical protein
VAALQHLLGLAMAVMIYVLLVRRGASRWLAAVAAAPVLLDAYQLQMEQMIMPDVWFEAAVVAALAILLWRPAVTVRTAVLAGLVAGASAILKQQGEVLALPAVVYLLAGDTRWRLRLLTSGALVAAFLVPVLGYCTVSYARTGHFWLAHKQSSTGRLVAAADCAALKLPAAARPLCPSPRAQSNGPDWLEHSKDSPLYAAPVPPGTKRSKLISAIDSAVVSQQPLRVVGSVVKDWGRLFSVTRTPSRWTTPISRWQFQTSYPVYPPWVELGPGNQIIVGLQPKVFGPFHHHVLNPQYGGRAQVSKPIATFLRTYQLRGGYTPGPLLALFVLAGLAGSLLALAARAAAPRVRQLALAGLLFTGSAAVLLLLPGLYEFSWRYQLPAVITLPPAGVLGATALAGYIRDHRDRRNAAAAGLQPAPEG